MISVERWEAALNRLPEGAAIGSHHCWTCSRCHRAFGLTGFVDVALGNVEKSTGGGYHYDIEWDGTPRVFGGRVSRVIGVTDEAAFGAVEAILSGGMN